MGNSFKMQNTEILFKSNVQKFLNKHIHHYITGSKFASLNTGSKHFKQTVNTALLKHCKLPSFLAKFWVTQILKAMQKPPVQLFAS